MKASLQGYFDQWETPWMRLYYRMVWTQLEHELGDLTGKKILDFGSGFGWNANYFAGLGNEVLAIEPNEEMVESRSRENEYHQLIGSLSALTDLSATSFDIILCHNVFEYCPTERAAILAEFDRLIKPDGIISIVKHNHAGAIMQKVVFENALDEAYDILAGGEKTNAMFGKINYYDFADLTEHLSVKIDKTYGVRTFWALQPNEVKTASNWADKMFRVEWEVCDKPEYVAISFFNHLIVRKTQ